jgi:thiol-disulfide isomerase/thioredoxin
MKRVLLALGALALWSQPTAPVPGPNLGKLPLGPLLDTRDGLPLLVGSTTSNAILAHRASFRDNLAKVKVTRALKARWQAVRRPLTLVAVFGSWCEDSQHLLPQLLALETDPNPFIEVHYLGVGRDLALEPKAWPKGCLAPGVDCVPSFYLFAAQPEGARRLVGAVVENPPKRGQTMAEALVELVERPTIH